MVKSLESFSGREAQRSVVTDITELHRLRYGSVHLQLIGSEGLTERATRDIGELATAGLETPPDTAA